MYRVVEASLGKIKVKILMGLMRAGVSFEPVRIVFGLDGKFTPQDGLFRTTAALLLGHTHLPCVRNQSPWFK
jgi:hypothetical protein